MENQQNNKNATVFTVLGFVFAGLSILVPLLGIPGIVFGSLLTAKKPTRVRGIIIIVLSTIFMVTMFTLGFMIRMKQQG